MNEWTDGQPIYRQLRDRGVHMILDGVLKAYQQLVDEDLVEKKRGLGMFVKPGARESLLKGERQKFLSEQWPGIARTIERLGLTPKELMEAAAAAPASAKPDKEEH